MKVVSAAFNAAVRQHIIESNPATALESLPIKTEERATFTPTQVSKLATGIRRRLERGDPAWLLHWGAAWRRSEYAMEHD